VTEVARGITAFYDIDTPVTLAKLASGDHEYLSAALVGRYDLYLSFTGGPTLARLERDWGAACARPLYCSVDPELYSPTADAPLWDLGYLGTYSADRQPTLDRLLLDVARRWPQGRFAVAGPQYPADIAWPPNLTRASHLAPAEHAAFYNRQRFTLNVTREAMITAGWSPSVRLFEAAACGTPIISDIWPGIEELFVPGEEILLARDRADVARYVRSWTEDRRLAVGRRARARVLREHTAAHRAEELEIYVEETLSNAVKRRQVNRTRTTTLIERSEP
jgi:spore maturation protein CgeB